MLTLEKLEALNGYCACEGLQDLYVLRKKSEELNALCNTLDQKIVEGSGKVFEIIPFYEETVNKFEASVQDYYTKLNEAIKKGDIKFVLRGSPDLSIQEYITNEQVAPLLQENKIITMHCSKCNNQVDLAEL